MERSGSVVGCLTQDRGAAGSSLTGVTALCPWTRHIDPSLVLVQPRKTRTYITERLLMVRNESNQTNTPERVFARMPLFSNDGMMWDVFFYIMLLSSNFLTDGSKAILICGFFFCYLCLSLSYCHLFLAALCSSVGKGLTSWLSCMWGFFVFLSHCPSVSRVRCGAWYYWFLIFAFFLTFIILKSTEIWVFNARKTAVCKKF